MIKKPKLGMKVISNNYNCCAGFKKGRGGIIVEIEKKDSFIVRNRNGTSWWHCRECVDEVKE